MLKLFQNRKSFKLRIFNRVLTQILCLGHHQKSEKRMWLTAALQPSTRVWCPGTPEPNLDTWELEPEQPGLQVGGVVLEEVHLRQCM